MVQEDGRHGERPQPIDGRDVGERAGTDGRSGVGALARGPPADDDAKESANYGAQVRAGGGELGAKARSQGCDLLVIQGRRGVAGGRLGVITGTLHVLHFVPPGGTISQRDATNNGFQRQCWQC